jgi:hypothetical protein
MKLFTIAMLVALGCGGGKKAETTTTGDTSTQPPAASAGVPCEQEIARVCENGTVDGCGDGKTTVHVCVAADASAGPPCEPGGQQALVCPEGQIDACRQTPASAANHICVVK